MAAQRTDRTGSSTPAAPPAPAVLPAPDPLTLEVVDLIGTVVSRYYADYEEAAAEHSLTGAQARVLRLLTLEPLPMRRIAQKLKCEPSNVTGIVDRLELRGLVERRPDPHDRRVKLAASTEKGAGTARLLRESLDFAREPLGELSVAERAVLRDLLKRMLGEDGASDGAASDAGGEARAGGGGDAGGGTRAGGGGGADARTDAG